MKIHTEQIQINHNLKPENFLMARIGRKVDPQTIEEFNLARFGI